VRTWSHIFSGRSGCYGDETVNPTPIVPSPESRFLSAWGGEVLEPKVFLVVVDIQVVVDIHRDR
jgi:hypothetical protein